MRTMAIRYCHQRPRQCGRLRIQHHRLSCSLESSANNGGMEFIGRLPANGVDQSMQSRTLHRREDNVAMGLLPWLLLSDEHRLQIRRVPDDRRHALDAALGCDLQFDELHRQFIQEVHRNRDAARAIATTMKGFYFSDETLLCPLCRERRCTTVWKTIDKIGWSPNSSTFKSTPVCGQCFEWLFNGVIKLEDYKCPA